MRGWLTSPAALVLLAVLLGLIGSLVLPVTARAVHRRRRARAPDSPALVEAQWDELVSRLGDLGIHPPAGGTLRDWREHYSRHGYLDDDADASMSRVVSTVERTRYGRPERSRLDVHEDVERVTRAASRSRPTGRRLHAFFLPDTGVRWWSQRVTAVTSVPARWGRTLRARLPRRRPGGRGH